MQKNLKKTLSFILTLVMVLGLVAPAIPVFADDGILTDTDVSIHEWNISLEDDIRANFYLHIDDSIRNDETYVTVQIGNDSYPYSLEMLESVNGNYLLPVNVAAAQMTEDINIQVHFLSQYFLIFSLIFYSRVNLV